MSQKSSKKKEMSDDAKVKFAKDSIKKLRDKILVGSTTNQNKLINFKHSDRGRGYTRIVDELNIKRSEIPAVTHVDYSARIQTVHKEINTKYYNLIKKFKEKTNCPVLVNTSFNVRGEPIVNTPTDAFNCFMGTELDKLAIGNCYLEKKMQNNSLKKNYEERYELD